MRQRWIFDIIDYLNSVHSELQNESSIVCFTYWVQMLLRCEIDEIANRVRDHFAILSNLDLTLRTFDKVFFKKTFESTCWKCKKCKLYFRKKFSLILKNEFLHFDMFW